MPELHLRRCEPLVEREIEQQHVHPRLAEETELPPFDTALDERAQIGLGDPARLRHARHLRRSIPRAYAVASAKNRTVMTTKRARA